MERPILSISLRELAEMIPLVPAESTQVLEFTEMKFAIKTAKVAKSGKKTNTNFDNLSS